MNTWFESKRPLELLILTLLVAYAVVLLVWLVLHLTVDDHWRIVFVVNALALYLFLPLPLFALAAVFKGYWPLLGVLSLESVIALTLWAPLFLPNDSKPSGAPTLSVATYNSLGYNFNTDAVIDSIAKPDADFVSLQELNPETADAITARLGTTYPYRLLRPQPGTTGMGIISKHPFTPHTETLADDAWVGAPQIVRLRFEGTDVTIAALHAAAPLRPSERLRQADKITRFVRSETGPVIVLGDFNSSTTNTMYSRLRSVLRDAWLDAGSGFGHTFPGASQATTPHSSRFGVAGLSVPPWLVRIDYVFYTAMHWRAVGASLGEHGGSDHRPVKAVFELKR